LPVSEYLPLMRAYLPQRQGYVYHRGTRVRAPSPEMTVEVCSRFGDFVPVLFRVDTGADVTTIPVRVAEE
jgi:hypothetical protein